MEAIHSFFGPRTRQEIVDLLVEHGVPAAPVNTVRDAVDEPPLREREMLVEVEHTERGKITITGSPLHMSETPGTVRSPSPVLGQDSRYVLGELLIWDDNRINLVLGNPSGGAM